MRFPGFEGEWEWHKLGECSKSLDYGMNASAIEYDGINKYIRITDIDENSSKYISNNPVSPDGNLLDKYIVQENDILFARTEASTGKSYLYDSQDGKLYFAGFLIRANIKDMFNAAFIFEQTQTIRYDRWVQLTSMRSGQPGINSQEYTDFDISITEKNEQDKIARFFSLINKRIATQREIIDKYESLIKGLRDYLFFYELEGCPKLRFLKCWDMWSLVKIGDILTIGNGRDYKHLRKGNIPVYGTGGYMTSVDQYLYDGESVCIGRKGMINKPFYLAGKFWTVDTLFYTHSFKNVLPRFCYFIFNRINWLKYNEASGVPSLSKTTIESIPVFIPPIEEQKKIVNILLSVDKKIKLEREILIQYENQKEYLLQQIFI